MCRECGEPSPRDWIKSFVGSMRSHGLTKDQISHLVTMESFQRWFKEEIDSAYGEETHGQDTDH